MRDGPLWCSTATKVTFYGSIGRDTAKPGNTEIRKYLTFNPAVTSPVLGLYTSSYFKKKAYKSLLLLNICKTSHLVFYHGYKLYYGFTKLPAAVKAPETDTVLWWSSDQAAQQQT